MINIKIIIFMTRALRENVCKRINDSGTEEHQSFWLLFRLPHNNRRTHKINVRYDSDNTNYISLFSSTSPTFPFYGAMVFLCCRRVFLCLAPKQCNVHLWYRHGKGKNRKQWRCTTECFMTAYLPQFNWLCWAGEEARPSICSSLPLVSVLGKCLNKHE